MVSNNIYIDDMAKRLAFCRHNALCKKLTSEVSEIDPILNYDCFREYVIKEILERGKKLKKTILNSIQYGEESEWYGHRRCLVDYCNGKYKNERFLLPNIMHGAQFIEYDIPLVGEDTLINRIANNYQVFITMSDYCIDQIHAIRPWLQIYPIGPYIVYAQGFYDESWIKNIREKNGKTALYFPQHSTETASVNFDKSNACRNIDYLMNNYDTVLVSVYWTDVDNAINDYYRDKGAKLVSSGVRSDKNFIRRQRSLYELADDVYGNALGTNVGYAMAMEKPYYFFYDDIKIIDDKINQEYMRKIEEQENKIKCIWNRNNDAEKKNIFEKFWGGKKYIKTMKEIKSILDIQQKLLKITHGNIPKMDKIIESIVRSGKQYDFSDDEIRLVLNAVCADRNM